MEDWSVPAVGCGGAGLIWGGFGGEQCSVPLTAPHCHLQPPVVLRGLCPARPAPEASMGTPSAPCGAPPRLGNTGADHPQHQSCIPPSGRHRYARWAVRRTHWCWLSGHSKCVWPHASQLARRQLCSPRTPMSLPHQLQGLGCWQPLLAF